MRKIPGLDASEQFIDEMLAKCKGEADAVRGSAATTEEKRYFRKEVLGRKGAELDHRFAPMLKRFGFRFIPRERLMPYEQGGMHKEGEWRHPRLPLAFTETDLLTLHGNSPQKWAEWFEYEMNRRRGKLREQRLASMGIVLGRYAAGRRA